MFNERFDTIVYCILYATYYTGLGDINLVTSETAKRSKSNVTCKKLYGGEIFQILVIFLQDLGLLPNIYHCVLLFDLQKKHDHQMPFSSHIELHITFFLCHYSKTYQKDCQHHAKN